MQGGSYLPLRWESTGEQWWYVSPIDCAAANGHYDLVRELLHVDANLLIKLTSLRRIRRLESVWDGRHVAQSRASVAKSLLSECESLLAAGYGGWLLYTAASAGDMGFVEDLLRRDPLLVLGEGEYGVTDMLYAAARSGSSRVFRLLMDSAVGLGVAGEAHFSEGFRREMMNRGVHCAARAGYLDLLKELLGGCSDVLAFRDAQGSSILHSAAARGHVEVVKHLIASFHIIDSTDNQGNTALHMAAYKGFFPVVEALLMSSPSLAASTNKEGNTFLHMAVSGLQVTSGFHRLDQQLDLVRHLLHSKVVNIGEIVNRRNMQGRTALHLAVSETIQFEAVELLMAVPSIHLSIKDSSGRTPMDILKRHPQSGSSRLLIKSLGSAGGTTSYREGQLARGATAARFKMESPGTSFRLPDSKMFLYAANEIDECDDEGMSEMSSCSLSGIITARHNTNSMSSAVARLKVLLQWPKRKDKGRHTPAYQSLEETAAPIPLRERFSINKKSSLLGWDFPPPSPCGKNNFNGRLKHDVIHHPNSPFRASTPCSRDKPKMFAHSQNSFSRKSSTNRYLCFGAQGMTTTQVT